MGFEPDRNEKGNATRQRWCVTESPDLTIDFLIEPTLLGDKGGTLRNLDSGLAAIIAPGLGFAFRDRELVTLTGKTLHDEVATRQVWVCGPGAFVVMKALAFRSRGENKDAYDLYYLIRNYGSGVEDVATRLRPLLDHSVATEAIEVLRTDFLAMNGVGPRRVAAFLEGTSSDDSIQADVVGFVDKLLRLISAGPLE